MNMLTIPTAYAKLGLEPIMAYIRLPTTLAYGIDSICLTTSKVDAIVNFSIWNEKWSIYMFIVFHAKVFKKICNLTFMW